MAKVTVKPGALRVIQFSYKAGGQESGKSEERHLYLPYFLFAQSPPCAQEQGGGMRPHTAQP